MLGCGRSCTPQRVKGWLSYESVAVVLLVLVLALVLQLLFSVRSEVGLLFVFVCLAQRLQVKLLSGAMHGASLGTDGVGAYLPASVRAVLIGSPPDWKVRADLQHEIHVAREALNRCQSFARARHRQPLCVIQGRAAAAAAGQAAVK